MLIRFLGLFACLALIGAGLPPANGGAGSPPASGLHGQWRNTKNTVHLRVQACGSAMCGTVVWAADRQRADARKGSGKDLVGSVLLRDLRPDGDGWEGKIFVPDINTMASATVKQLDSDTLLVSGCTMMGILCRTQHWYRM